MKELIGWLIVIAAFALGVAYGVTIEDLRCGPEWPVRVEGRPGLR